MLNLLIGEHTERGTRERNEDAMLHVQADGSAMFALADGVGGNGLGDVASRTACEAARDCFLTRIKQQQDLYDLADEVYEEGYCRICDLQRKCLNGKNMATTLNILTIGDGLIYQSHIGDSRTYRFQGKELVSRTFDHSLSEFLARTGEISEEEIRHHEDRNILLKALGGRGPAPAFEEEENLTIRSGQKFLLCSDGFWELLTEKEMTELLRQSDSPQNWVDRMMDFIHNEREQAIKDNISVMAVWIEE